MKTTIKNCHNEAPLFWKENYKYIINPLEIDNYKNITIYQLVRSKVISCWFKAKRIIKKLIGKK